MRPALALTSLALTACSVAPPPPPTLTPGPAVARSPVPTLTPLPPPSATPLPSATPEPSDTPPPPSPTPDSYAEPGGGELLFQDSFDAAGVWGVGDADEFAIAVEAGALTITLKQPDRWALTFGGRQAADFYAQVSAAAANCGGQDSYGLLYRFVDAANFYYFGVGCGARYRVRHYQAGVWREIVDWTQADSIAHAAGEDGARRLAVRAFGERFYFFANGVFLGQASDSALAAGRFGLLAHAGSEAGLTVAFDDLQVRAAAP